MTFDNNYLFYCYWQIYFYLTDVDTSLYLICTTQQIELIDLYGQRSSMPWNHPHFFSPNVAQLDRKTSEIWHFHCPWPVTHVQVLYLEEFVFSFVNTWTDQMWRTFRLWIYHSALLQCSRSTGTFHHLQIKKGMFMSIPQCFISEFPATLSQW